MAKFAVRIEIHHPSSESNYKRLNRAMARAGFLRQVLLEDEEPHDLPLSQFEIITGASIDAVTLAVHGAAEFLGDGYTATICEVASQRYLNLRPV